MSMTPTTTLTERVMAAKTSRRRARDDWSPITILDDDLYSLIFSFLGLKYAPCVGATCKAWFVLQWQRLRRLRSLEFVRTLPTELHSPMFADGEYVCDTRDHSIKHVCAETGAVRQTLRQPAWRRPRGVCVTPSCLYVVAWSPEVGATDFSRLGRAGVHRLRRSDGTLLASAFSCGGEPLRNPHGCTVVEGAVVFVADTGRDRVCVFDLELRPLFQLGGFAQPNSIASHPGSREIYVCDTYNHRLAVFRLHRRRPSSPADVSLARTIGGEPPDGGERHAEVARGGPSSVPAGHFYMPRSVAVSADRIVVVEASRVHVLTRQGEPLLVHEAKAYGLLRGVVSAPAAHRIILVDEGASRLHLLSTRCATAPTALVLGDLARVVSGGKRAKSLHALARFEVARHVERRRSEASSSTHQETLLRQYKSDDSDDSDGGDESDGGDDSDDGDESASDSGSGDESESDDAASDNEFAALEPDDGDGSDASDQSDADERDYGDSSEEAEESGSGC
mmetsp:Transcript_11289/g.33703  ORF Transcript_11289/g.33703 Transcript_11289/m.33703 type:complete len:507 (+) Transcript_11289:14-1534(+)